MIYLTLDNNIWIYLFEDAWKEQNPLDLLEHWSDEGHISFLLPEVIYHEWSIKKEEQKNSLKKKLHEFFNMANEILPSDFVRRFKTPENISQIIDKQFSRIENLLNSKTFKIVITEEVKNRIYEDGLKKLAPLHRKSSTADAVLVYSLINFAENNQNNEFFFISNNVDDFCSKENKDEIHTDLKDDFNKNNIQFFRNINSVIKDLTKKIPITIDLDELKESKLKTSFKSQIINPYVINSLITSDSYLNNIEMMDLVLKTSSPTKHQIITILSLFEENQSYRSYFFKKADSPIWFMILKEKGFFNCKNNPSPIPIDSGFSIPPWEVMDYLIKISNEFKNGQSLNLVNDLIVIILKTSRNPVDNYSTWFRLIKVLNNIPNDSIIEDVLHYIPVWLNSDFENSLQSIELCNHTFPKFLNNNPSKSDIEKASIILNHLFNLKTINIGDKISLTSQANLHQLQQTFSQKSMLTKFAEFLDDSLLLDLGNKIKKLLFDYPEGIIAYFGISNEFQAKLTFTENDLNFYIIDSKAGTELSHREFPYYENLRIDEIILEIKEEIKNNYPNYLSKEVIEDPVFKFAFLLKVDRSSFIGKPSIHNLGERHRKFEIYDVYALVFRNWLNEIVTNNLVRGSEILKTFHTHPKYQIPFFKRITLYIIGKHWNELNVFFWNLIGTMDELLLFSNSSYHKELFYLLREHSSKFKINELKILDNIIEKGDQIEKNNNQDNHKSWKLRWYSALKDHKHYKERYEQLSLELNYKSEDFENQGKVRIRPSETPFSSDDLLTKPNSEILEIIISFNPDRWKSNESIGSLADSLGKAVSENPEQFVSGIQDYKNVPFIYAYHLLLGLEKAWKNKKFFNWEKVLEFSFLYITSSKFYTNKLKLENDGWGADNNWVVGALSNLISEGLKDNENTIEPSLLPKFKKIIKILGKNIFKKDDFEESNMEYTTYSLNSTAGKVTRAILDYSLYYARKNHKEEQVDKWEKDIKDLYNELIKKEIIDSFILEGMYFEQFYFLDKNWIIDRVNENLNNNEKYLLAFLGGFSFTYGPQHEEIYRLLIPHYKKAISLNKLFSSGMDKGLIRHIVTFYFWDFEQLNDGGLLYQLINEGHTDSINDTINFIGFQDDYFESLNEGEKIEFEKMIDKLWEYVLNKYQSIENTGNELMVSSLINFIKYLHEFNERNVSMILKSSLNIVKFHHTYDFLKSILDVSKRTEISSASKYVGKLLNSISYKSYIPDFETDIILELTKMLYENNQKEYGNDLCNKLSEEGHEFLKETYKFYNN